MDKNRTARPPAMRRAGTTLRSRRFSRGGSTLGGSASGGKCGGRAETQRVLTWGDPAGATWRGVSRSRSRCGSCRALTAAGNELRKYRRWPHPTEGRNLQGYTTPVLDSCVDAEWLSLFCRGMGASESVCQTPDLVMPSLRRDRLPRGVACRNRRMRTRMYGGVGAGADLLGQSPATRFGLIIFSHEATKHTKLIRFSDR